MAANNSSVGNRTKKKSDFARSFFQTEDKTITFFKIVLKKKLFVWKRFFVGVKIFFFPFHFLRNAPKDHSVAKATAIPHRQMSIQSKTETEKRLICSCKLLTMHSDDFVAAAVLQR